MLSYSAKVLEHFRAPRNVGRVQPWHGLGRIGDPACGDFVEVTIRLSDDYQQIAAIGYLVKGCPAAIATASMTAELAEGCTVEAAVAITDGQVTAALDGLPPGKEHCSLLAVRGLQLALQNAVLRLLFKRSGIVDSDEAFDHLVETGGIERFLHRCDGSCEEAKLCPTATAPAPNHRRS